MRYHCGGASHMQRNVSTLVMAVVLCLAGALTTASAQGLPTGTLVGHLTRCKIAPRPMGQSDGEPSPLADVTPGMGHRPLSVASIRVPAADVQVALMGIGLSATTDASGGLSATALT